MKWQSVIPRSLVLALCMVTVLLAQPTWPSPPTGLYVQPSGSGTTVVIPNAVIAATCSQTHVATALAAVSAGGTVLIPAGTCNWTTQTLWTAPANVTVRGAGDLSTVGGGDQTVIVDDYVSGNALLSITGSATGTFRIAGITFRGGSSGDNVKYSGFLSLHGGGARISARVDHVTMDMSTYATAYGRAGTCMAVAGVYGVIDNSAFPDTQGNCIRIYDAEGMAHQAWADATGLGTNQSTYLEDNTFGVGLADDCQGGGKMVWRYNTLTNTGIQVHATGGTGARGCRAWEIYGNTFTDSVDPPYQTAFWGSSGTGVVWGNSAGGSQGYKNLIQLFSYRRSSATNTATKTPEGFGYCGPGRASGTVNVSSGAGTTLTRASGDNFSTTNWPDNSMIIVDGTSFEIVSVASTTSLTIRQADAADLGGSGPLPSTKAGLSGVAYSVGSNWDGNTEAATGYPCIDTPGRGQGDLITGTSPNMTNAATGCISSQSCAWLRQALEPVYEWLNLPFTPAAGYGGSLVNVSREAEVLIENRDFYKYTESFTGVAGVGSGARSSRPGTCTTGVAYWSTDQGGNWNTSNGDANDGTLDVCTETNTWTNASYTPYTYPHPLRGGS
jgi:hypothetical protein